MIEQNVVIIVDSRPDRIRSPALLKRDSPLPNSIAAMPVKIEGTLPKLVDGDKALLEMGKKYEMLFNKTQALYHATIDTKTWAFTATRP